MQNAAGPPEKAYKDVGFLNSRDARTVRILAEYLHPQQRFREEGIQNTVVFFGFARIRDVEATETALAEAKKGGSPQDVTRAQRGVDMARYYEDAVELARLLTEWSKGLESSH